MMVVVGIRSESLKTTSTTQAKRILNHLKAGNSMTQRSALMDFGIMSVSKRISELREHGHDIRKVMEKNNHTEQRYMRYWLADANGNAMKAAA